VKVKSPQNPFVVASLFKENPLFDYVEFDAIGVFHTTPNDPYYSNQWNLSKISMPSAWDITTGSNSVILAIIDCGVDYNHEDLAGNIWVNPAEDRNGNGHPDFFSYSQGGDLDGIDNDGNGYVDDLIGWDFKDSDCNPWPDYHWQQDGHGTAVAGIAAALTNNSKGVAGVAGGWGSQAGVKIMVLRYAYHDIYGPYASTAAQAMQYAALNGAKVINCSFGWDDPWEVLSDAVYYVTGAYNCVIVCSAGNYGGKGSSDKRVLYPARYANTIAVGATIQDDSRWELNDPQGSSYGPELDVMAPGGTIYGTGIIYTTDITGSYGYQPGNYMPNFGGTSAAAPHVAGLAALIRSVNPSLTWSQVRSAICLSADKVPGMGGQDFTEEYGYGRINAYKALKYTLEHYGGTLTSSLNIPSGETWTFQPGVTIKFNTGYSTMIVVNSGGKVIAEGTSANPITFEHASGISYWTAFSINSSGNIFKYCNFKHAGTDLSFSGVSGTNTIQNCNFQNYNNAAMYFSNSDYNGSTINLSSCTFQGNGKELQYSGNVKLTNSVNIPSNVTLTVNNGTSVKFNGYYSLAVQSGAKIIANGTQANPIVFTSATGSSPGSWQYVILYGGNNVFKHCEFRYGYRPLYLNYCAAAEGARNLIESCKIHHNSSYGIYIYRSLANIKGCDIYNNSHGIYCYYYSDVRFTGDSLSNNSDDGIFSYSNNFLEFYGNVIQQNGRYGIYTKSADHLHIGEPYGFYGYNTVRFNGNTEVYAGSGNTHVEANYSSIHEENPSAPGYEIYNDPENLNLFTQNCFWGNNCTPKYYGNITFQNPQCTPTWDGHRFLDGPLGKMNINRTDDLVKDSDNGFIIDLSLSDEEKIKSCKKIIANQPNSKDACDALIFLYSILRADYLENTLGERNDFYSYLNNLYSKHANKGAGKTALRYMIYWKILEGDDETAIKLSNKALGLFTGEEYNDILANLAITHTHRGELKEAKSILNEIIARCSAEDELVRIVAENIADVEWQIAQGIWEQDKTGKPLPPPEDQPVSSAPDEFAFSANYPNPFNAVTTITFSLPEASQVKAEVYDLTGRCVAVLCDRSYPVGIYSVQFDGSALASGIYILHSRMTAIENPGKSQVFTRKMMLMK